MISSRYGSLTAILIAVLAWAESVGSARAVVFVNPQNLLNPSTGFYDEFYTPPQLLHPSSSYMAMIGGAGPGTNPPPNPPATGTGGASGVVIGPHWVLTARHNGTPVYDSNGIEISRNFVGKPIWVNGVNYRVDSAADQFITDGSTDLALLRITAANNSYAQLSDYASIDPNMTLLDGTAMTQGGFSNQLQRDNSGQLTGATYIRPGLLTWGRNYVISGGLSNVQYSYPSSEQMPYQGFGWSNDSGGGYFVRDGWNWRLVATTLHPADGARLTSPDNYAWINQVTGGLPSLQASSRPPATVEWTGGYGDWNVASNWEDTSTYLPRLPALNEARFDTVNIKSQNTGPVISSSAAAGQIFVGGTSSGNYAELTINSGGDLKANTIFIGGDLGDKGLVSMYGGTINSDTQYIGYRGSVGGLYQEGGINNAVDVYIGKNNTGFAVYEMAGSSTFNARPILNARGVQIGGLAGSNGQLFIGGGSGPHSEIQTTEQTVVGARGNGSVTQWQGTHNAGRSLVLGQSPTGYGSYYLTSGTLNSGYTQVGDQGTASFTHSGGTHTTEILKIGVGDAYRISGGSLVTREIANQGIFESSGGTVTTNLASGTLDFKNAGGTLRGVGIVNLEDASITNNSSAHLIVDVDSLVILPSANTFATTTKLGSLDPHVAGTTLLIDGAGFKNSGAGVISDPVVLTNGGYIGSRGVGNWGTFEKGVRVTSTSSAPITASLSAEINSLPGFYDQLELWAFQSDGPTRIGLQTDAGTKLRAKGRYLLIDTNARIEINGTLEIGGDLGPQAISRLHVRALNDVGAARFSLTNTATTVLNISRDTAIPAQPLIADSIKVDTGLVSISGQLRIEELAGILAAPKEQVTLITTSANKRSGIFSSIMVEDGDPLTSGLLLNTSGGEAAYAVTYTSSSVVARVSLPGDFNLDDVVNTADQLVWQANVGTNSGWSGGDATGDGWVDGSDLMIFQRNFGRSWPSLQMVPEPTAMSLMVLSMALVLRRRRTGSL